MGGVGEEAGIDRAVSIGELALLVWRDKKNAAEKRKNKMFHGAHWTAWDGSHSHDARQPLPCPSG